MPLPPFASVGDAYDAALALLTDSLERTWAGGGLASLGPQDRLLLDVLHMELVRTCAALVNKGWRSSPVSREALVLWSRHATEAREGLRGVAPAGDPPPAPDALIEGNRSRAVPGRLRGVEPLDVPVLGVPRALRSLLLGLPSPCLARVGLNLLAGPPPVGAEVVSLATAALLAPDGLSRVLAGLGPDAMLLLQGLRDAGGELPLASLSLGLGPVWQEAGQRPTTPLAELQCRGLVFVGWDDVQQDVLVVVPPEVNRLLAPSPGRSSG